MKNMSELANENIVSEDLDIQYDKIIEQLKEAKANKTPIDEGLIAGILGGVAGATVGPAVMRAICSALGINEKGALGNLMTSRLILTAVGSKVGWRV